MKKLSSQLAQELIKTATRTMQNSYSPYSKFKVGAALLTGSGKIYGGTNIENASFGLTNCAERTAVFSAVAAGEKTFEALAIVFNQKSLSPISTPCGACRQVLAEFCPPDMPVLTVAVFDGKTQQIIKKKLKDYYPYPFTLKTPVKQKIKEK